VWPKFYVSSQHSTAQPPLAIGGLGPRPTDRDRVRVRVRDGNRDRVRDGVRDGNRDRVRDGVRDGNRDRDRVRDGNRDRNRDRDRVRDGNRDRNRNRDRVRWAWSAILVRDMVKAPAIKWPQGKRAQRQKNQKAKARSLKRGPGWKEWAGRKLALFKPFRRIG
jgi:hypothetical protein